MNPKNDNPENKNQLDLEFNQIERITPKKTLVNKPSLFDKVLGFTSSLSSKETIKVVNNTVSQAPIRPAKATKDTSPNEYSSLNTQNTLGGDVSSISTTSNDTINENIENNTSASLENNQTEQIISTQDNFKSDPILEKTKVESELKQPENWKILQFLPAKHRRLVVALAVLLLILLAYFTLRIDNQTVDTYQPESNSIPTEFQPLAPNQQVITNDNQVNETTPATGHQITANNIEANESTAEITQPKSIDNNNTIQIPVEQSIPKTSTAPIPSVEMATQSRETKQIVQNIEPAQHIEKAVEHKTKQIIKKPTIEKSMEKAKTPSARIVEAKPTHSTKATTQQLNTKTLSIEKGKTLFQLFRDNNLDIRDANAMTKANGAGNVLNSFKSGDRVQISIHGNRVIEMRLPNGSRFIRQNDGTYNYK